MSDNQQAAMREALTEYLVKRYQYAASSDIAFAKEDFESGYQAGKKATDAEWRALVEKLVRDAREVVKWVRPVDFAANDYIDALRESAALAEAKLRGVGV